MEESPLPPSQRAVALERFQPPEALDQIGDWYPGDWRLHLFRGLTDTSRQERLTGLLRADSLRPDEPLIPYFLCLAYLESGHPEDEKLARLRLDKALALDPGNGVLRILEAYLLLKEGDLPRARTLFTDARRVPGGDFHYARLESLLLGLFSHSRHLNPYTLTEAVELYRKVPLPPFEKLVDILYSVFLSPLPDHPYDIRTRGREAAHGLFLLGRRLRAESYTGPGVLSSGYEQRAMGFMFQLKAGEFLTLFYRAFEDTAASRRSFQELMEVQGEYQAFMDSHPWEDSLTSGYLEGWGRLIRETPRMPLRDAVDKARRWGLWSKAMAFRYPARDNP